MGYREKPWREKNELDQIIRQTLNLGMEDTKAFLVIEFVYGFEKFGSYETWAGGYRITDHKNKIVLERPDLDVAIRTWHLLVDDIKNGTLTSSIWERRTYELNHKEQK